MSQIPTASSSPPAVWWRRLTRLRGRHAARAEGALSEPRGNTHFGARAAHEPQAGMNLAQLPQGVSARVVRLQMPGSGHGHDRNTVLRLLEIGFVVGERVRVIAYGPGGREPLAVRVGHSLFALRRHEAEHVWVEPEQAAP